MKTKVKHIFSAAVLGIFIIMAFGSGDSDGTTENTVGNQNSTTEIPANVANDPVSNWNYSNAEDKMEGIIRYFATAVSTNELQFDFPYNGGSSFDLIVRNMGRKNELLLTVSKGQFIGSYAGSETIKIKFDDEKPIVVSYNSADDGSSDVIFINSAARIITKLKSAKKVMIEAPFYDAGRQIIYFDVEGFTWDR